MIDSLTQDLIDELYKKTGFSTCFITSLLALTHPARTALKTFLQQQRSLLELKINKLAFQIQRNNMLSDKFNDLFSVVSRKLNSVKNIINVTHFGDIVQNCPELQKLLQSMVKGAGVPGLRIEGFSDVENILQEINYRLQSANAALDIATRARDQLNNRLEKIDLWINLLNLM
ncbi:MAG: hypothetical protein KAW92_11890 [Candidatus Cloacimonetes bacterium]|nr:hypothetical protein [Candidatus Cloacimonadota bacterium]